MCFFIYFLFLGIPRKFIIFHTIIYFIEIFKCISIEEYIVLPYNLNLLLVCCVPSVTWKKYLYCYSFHLTFPIFSSKNQFSFISTIFVLFLTPSFLLSFLPSFFFFCCAFITFLDHSKIKSSLLCYHWIME